MSLHHNSIMDLQDTQHIWKVPVEFPKRLKKSEQLCRLTESFRCQLRVFRSLLPVLDATPDPVGFVALQLFLTLLRSYSTHFSISPLFLLQAWLRLVTIPFSRVASFGFCRHVFVLPSLRLALLDLILLLVLSSHLSTPINLTFVFSKFLVKRQTSMQRGKKGAYSSLFHLFFVFPQAQQQLRRKLFI